MKIDSPLALPRTRKNSYPTSQIAGDPPPALALSLLAYLKKMLGSTAFEHASSKLPPAGTVTKPGCRATKEEESVSKSERLNPRS
jgi:hypothetical protein